MRFLKGIPTFSNALMLQAHFTAEINKLITERFPGFWQSERKQEGRTHECSECGEALTTRATLQRHLGVHHRLVWDIYSAKSQTEIVCKEEARSSWPSEKNVVEKKNVPEESRGGSNKRNKFKDEKWTLKKTSSISDQAVDKHSKNETGITKELDEEKYDKIVSPSSRPKDGLGNPLGKLKCQICEFRTNFRWYLKKHILSKHDNKQKYKFDCPECAFQTNFRWFLDKHCNNKHIDCKPSTTEKKQAKAGLEVPPESSKASHLVVKEEPPNEEVRPVNKPAKKVRRSKTKTHSGFQDMKLQKVPDLNPYSRQLSSSSRRFAGSQGGGGGVGGGGGRRLEEERERNRAESLTEPYCRVCQLLLEPGKGILHTGTLFEKAEGAPW